MCWDSDHVHTFVRQRRLSLSQHMCIGIGLLVTKSKSSDNEDYKAALTFGWFGSVFLSVSMHKLPILADPVLTFYKGGIVGLAKKVSHTTTTQRTQQPTRASAALPSRGFASIAMTSSAIASNHGTLATCVSVALFVFSFGASAQNPPKNRALGVALALVGGKGRLEVGKEAHGG